MHSRPLENGLIYLRRSTDTQDNSLQMQLEWAVKRANELKVTVTATVEDLKEMQAIKLNSFKSIRLDDAISGTKTERPGFSALQRDAKTDTSISHVFVQKRDRLGRPQDPLELASIEKSIRQLGISIVFDDKIVGPTELGTLNLGEDIGMLIDYHTGRSWLERNTERIVDAKVMYAKQGWWTGGRAPYGFKRVLVGPDGKILEELEDGRKVSQSGCHVEIVHGPQEKLNVVMRILDLKYDKWSDKRIAKTLNDEGVPSPDSGRIRTDQGFEHTVTGKWSPNTIKGICECKMTIGLLQTGRRSGGSIRRMDPNGNRKLDKVDLDSEGKPKSRLHNDEETIIAKTSFEPIYDVEKWNKIQAIRDARGKSQRGIPKSKEAGKYPLACRVIDQSSECGSIMYGKSNTYTCGRYMRTSCSECRNNHVDGEALLRVSLKTMQQIVEDKFGRAALVQRLESRAAQEKQNLKADGHQVGLSKLIHQQAKLAQSVEVAARRMAEENDDELYKALANQFKQLNAELKCVDEKIAAMQQTENRRVVQTDDVDLALTLFDNLADHVNAPELRESFANLVQKADMHVGLTFAEAIKGKKRIVQKLTGGIVTFSESNLPVPIHGKDRTTSGWL